MQNTYRISKAAPILSYLPRLIKMFRAVVERSANMPKHPLINYPRLYPLLHMTTKNHICVLVLSHIQSFVLMPLVLSSPATVTVYRLHTTFFQKTTLSGSWDLKTWIFVEISTHSFFTMTILSLSWKFFLKKKLTRETGLQHSARPPGCTCLLYTSDAADE